MTLPAFAPTLLLLHIRFLARMATPPPPRRAPQQDEELRCTCEGSLLPLLPHTSNTEIGMTYSRLSYLICVAIKIHSIKIFVQRFVVRGPSIETQFHLVSQSRFIAAWKSASRSCHVSLQNNFFDCSAIKRTSFIKPVALFAILIISLHGIKNVFQSVR